MASVEASGIAKAGLTTGIIGTSLAGLLAANNGGGGLLGGLFGGGNAAAMAGQGAYQAAISAKDAEIGQLKAERYADHVGTRVYEAAAAMSNKNDDRIQSNLKDAFNELIVTRERLATNDANFKCLADSVTGIKSNVADLNREVADMRVREQQTADAIDCLAKSTTMRFDSVYNALECAKKECGAALALESERRAAGDQNLMCYVNATFVPGKLVMPKSSICPSVMPEFNTWKAPTESSSDSQPAS